MPKVIKGVKARVLECAKRQLLTGEGEGLTLRGVAAQCQIAVGTIYNYFPNKDILIAEVMVEDWVLALKTMHEGCALADTVEAGCRVMYDAIRGFVKLYVKVWARCGLSADTYGMLSKNHIRLRSQLSEILSDLVLRLGAPGDTALCGYLAEMVLTGAMQGDIPYAVIKTVICRVFPDNTKTEE